MTACGATNRKGTLCAQPAGFGTDHPGFGRCKFHGGASPAGKAYAERLMAEHAVVTYGLPREIDPHAALEEELWRTAGAVSYLSAVVANLDQRDLKQYQHMEAGGTVERPAIWVGLYQSERKHLTEVAKTCITCGIEERRVRLVEGQGQQLAQVLRGVLTELGVYDRPETPVVVRRHLTLIAGTG